MSRKKQSHIQNKHLKPSVLNLVKKQLPESHQALLNLGPKFVPVVRTVPHFDIITNVEIAVQQLSRNENKPGYDGEQIRDRVANILSKNINFKPKNNLTPEQRSALKELKSSEEIKVVPYDKGSGFAVMTKDDMMLKMKEQIPTSKIITKDPTNSLVKKFQTQLSRLRREDKINNSTFYDMYPSDANPPRMYGMIKAHKPNKQYPMRPVVSTVGTAFHGTSRHLVKLIQPILAQNEHFLKNSTSFVTKASTWKISPDEIQVSYDVVALYPSVPINKAINVMIDMLNMKFDMIKCNSKLTIVDIKILIELCLSKCYFVWNDTMFEVPDSGPIGLSLMVVVSEAFLQFIEKNAIQQSLNKQCLPISFLRYVDDSHSRFESSRDANNFLDILNQQDECIQYTMEMEDDKKQLGFLDVSITNSGNGMYEFQVYRKDAITNVQTKPHSSINPKIFPGVFKGFLVRASRVCSSQHLDKEIDFLIEVFFENGHKRNDLERIAAPFCDKCHATTREPSTVQEKKPIVKLPWIPGLSVKLRRILKKDFRVIFTSAPDLKRILCNHKTPLPRNSQPGVYSFACNCGKSYVGETKKKVSTRIKEHQKDVFHGRWEKTGASEHAKNCQEGFKWDEARTLAVEDQWHARKIREALFIRSRQREGQIITNRDTGQLKTRQWDPILGKLAKKRQSSND